MTYGTVSRSFLYDPWTLRRKSFPTKDHANAVTYDAYDPAGRLTQFTIAQGGLDDGTYSLMYDVAGRVDHAHYSGDGTGADTTYQYDAAGRMTKQVLPDGRQRAFAYDALGNLVGAQTAEGDGGNYRTYDYMYNAASELLAVDAGWARIDYSYDYGLSSPSDDFMLSITRTRTRSDGITKRIEFGYDARLSREIWVKPGDVLIASYLWYPFATGQLEVLTTPSGSGTVSRNFVDALGGPLMSRVGSSAGSIVNYEQSSVADAFRQSPFFTPQPVRGLTDQEHFRMFARRSGLDGTAGSGLSVTLGFSGTRSGAFTAVSDFLGALGRRDEVPPRLAALGAVESLPRPAYFDEDAERMLAPPSLAVPSSLGAVGGIDTVRDLGGQNDILGLGLVGQTGRLVSTAGGVGPTGCSVAHPSPGCPGYLPTVGADVPTSGEEPQGTTPPGVNFPGRRYRGGCSSIISRGVSYGCPVGPGCNGLMYDSIRDMSDQEPYKNASGDPYGVEVSSGEYVQSVTDLEIPWPGIPFRFTRTYRSKIHKVAEMGANWSHNYMERLRAGGTDCNQVQWVRADQWAGTFQWDQSLGLYKGPTGSHLVMRQLEGVTRYVIRLPDGELHHFDQNGLLTKITDRFGNTLHLFYKMVATGTAGVGVWRIGYVRGILDHEVVFDYEETTGLLKSITDCGAADSIPNGTCDVAGATRTILFKYLAAGTSHNLTEVISPVVKEDDGSGQIITTFGDGKKTTYGYGTDPERHNLKTITDGKANSTGGSLQPFKTIEYYDNYGENYYDNVKKVHFRHAQGVTKVIDYGYWGATTTVLDRLTPRTKTEYVFNYQRQLQTRKVYLTTTDAIIDTYEYTPNGEVKLSRTGEYGGSSHLEEYLYDDQGNMIERRVGSNLVTRYTYDPIYNQLRTTTDARAFPDGIVDTDVERGRPYEPVLDSEAVGKYTTTRYFDYQERPKTFLDAYVETWKLLPALNASSSFFAAFDLNGDGTVSQWAGGVVKEMHDLWSNPEGSGTLLETLTTKYVLNTMGQPIRTETEMGSWPSPPPPRVTTFLYGSSGEERGQLTSKTVQMGASASSADLTTTYTHDTWGNLKTETDPRGVKTTYFVNSLNQIYRIRRADTVSGADPFKYDEEFVHDANNNVTERRIQNTLSTPRLFTTITFAYDDLDRKVSETIQVDGIDRKTSYQYDEEGRLIYTFLPVGNVIGFTYDPAGRRVSERRFATRSVNSVAPPADETLDALTLTGYNGRGQATSVGNMIGSTTSTKTTFVYDPYDRRTQTLKWLDSDNDGTTGDSGDIHEMDKVFYDVAGLVTGTERWGALEGSSTSTTINLLAKTVLDNDEMGRPIRSCSLLSNTYVLDHTTPNSNDPCMETWYTRAGQVKQVKDPNGTIFTTFTYDLAGRQTLVQGAGGHTVGYTYDKGGNVTDVLSTEYDAEGESRTYLTRTTYDALGRVMTTRVDPDGALNLLTQYTYDAKGNVTSVVDPDGHRTEKVYNEANQVTDTRLCRKNPALPCASQYEERTQVAYDKNGLLYSQKDGNDETTQFWYDQLDRKVYTVYPDGTGVRVAYDRAGRAVQVRRQQTIGGAYVENDHLGSDPGYTCPAGGSSACLVENVTYDTLNRVKTKSFSRTGPSLPEYGGTSSQAFTYDGLSRPATAFDNNGDGTGDDTTITRTYDTLSRVLSESQQIGPIRTHTPTVILSSESTSSGYDKNGNRLRMIYPSGLIVSYIPDALNRLSKVVAGAGSPEDKYAEYRYLGPGLLQSRTYGNGVVLQLKKETFPVEEGKDGYDNAKRITRFDLVNTSGTALLSLDYGYNADSLRTFERRLHAQAPSYCQTQNNPPGQTFEHNYDHDSDGTYDASAHRLERFKEGCVASDGVIQSGTLSRRQKQGYDFEGNWIGFELDKDGNGVNEENHTNGLIASGLGKGMNQYALFKSAPPRYTFTGALTQDADPDGTGNRIFRYDALDRLIQVDRDGTTSHYSYDAENRRVEKRINGTATQFVYDGWKVLEEDVNADGSYDQRYIWANGMERLLAVERKSGATWTRYYSHGDVLGSQRAITTTSGAKVAELRYGGFGELMPLDPGVPNGEEVACAVAGCLMPFRYTGQRFDPESGLYYYKNRYYSPEGGRFITRDPAEYVNGSNLYSYVRNTSSTLTDPSGLSMMTDSGPLNTYFGQDGNMSARSMGGDPEADARETEQKAAQAQQDVKDASDRQDQHLVALMQQAARKYLEKQNGGGESGAGGAVTAPADSGAAGKAAPGSAETLPAPTPPPSESGPPSAAPASASGGAKVDTSRVKSPGKATKLMKDLMNPSNPDGPKSVEAVRTLANSGQQNASEVEAYIVEKNGNVQIYDYGASGDPLSSPLRALSSVAKDCNCTAIAPFHPHPIDPGQREKTGSPQPSGIDQSNLQDRTYQMEAGFIFAPGGTYYYGAVGKATRIMGGPQL